MAARAETMGFNAMPDTVEGQTVAAAVGPRVLRVAYENRWIQSGGWAKFDRIVKIAHDRGMRVLANALGTVGFTNPGYSGHSLGGPAGDWTPILQFRDYCLGLCEHGADMIEFWNEPNHPDFDASAPNPAAWALYMYVASTAVKAAYPSVPTISGALAPYGDLLKPNGRVPLVYFADALKALPRMLDSIDWVGQHIYNWFNGGSSLTTGYRYNSAQQIADGTTGGRIFKGLWTLGGHRPVAVTETGWPSSGQGGTYLWTPDAAAKAMRDTFRALDDLRTKGITIPLTIIHALHDNAYDKERKMGVLNDDDTWRPTAREVLREAMRSTVVNAVLPG